MSTEERWWPYEFDYGEECKSIIKEISAIQDEAMTKIARMLMDKLDDFANNAERGGLVAQRVRDLHKPAPWCCAMCDGDEEQRCSECYDQPYPCPTIKALDGEQE